MDTTTPERAHLGIRAAAMAADYYRWTLPGTLVLAGIGTLLALIYGVTAAVGRLVLGLPGWPRPYAEPVPLAAAVLATAVIVYGVLPAGFAAYGLFKGVRETG